MDEDDVQKARTPFSKEFKLLDEDTDEEEERIEETFGAEQRIKKVHFAEPPTGADWLPAGFIVPGEVFLPVITGPMTTKVASLPSGPIAQQLYPSLPIPMTSTPITTSATSVSATASTSAAEEKPIVKRKWLTTTDLLNEVIQVGQRASLNNKLIAALGDENTKVLNAIFLTNQGTDAEYKNININLGKVKDVYEKMIENTKGSVEYWILDNNHFH